MSIDFKPVRAILGAFLVCISLSAANASVMRTEKNYQIFSKGEIINIVNLEGGLITIFHIVYDKKMYLCQITNQVVLGVLNRHDLKCVDGD